jgi:hypothetical protein
MMKVATAFPEDANTQALAADAHMDLRPWDYWEVGGETPNEVGAQVLGHLEAALAIDPVSSLAPSGAALAILAHLGLAAAFARATRDSGTGAATPWAVTLPRPDCGPGGPWRGSQFG